MPPRATTAWATRKSQIWNSNGFARCGIVFALSILEPVPTATVVSGKPLPVRAAIELAGLEPGDVRVEMVMGRIDSNGHLEETEVMVLPAVEKTRQRSPSSSKDILPERTGRLGYALRVSPNHFRRSAHPAL